jgi:hypothetical protein
MDEKYFLKQLEDMNSFELRIAVANVIHEKQNIRLDIEESWPYYRTRLKAQDYTEYYRCPNYLDVDEIFAEIQLYLILEPRKALYVEYFPGMPNKGYVEVGIDNLIFSDKMNHHLGRALCICFILHAQETKAKIADVDYLKKHLTI